VPNLVEIGQTGAVIWRFFDFSKMAAVRHLGFVMCVFGPPTKDIWWSLSLCKIWLESVSIFDNMHVFRFPEFGLKTPIYAPKIGVVGDFTPKWGAISTEPKKAHPCASPRRLNRHARKSVWTRLTYR